MGRPAIAGVFHDISLPFIGGSSRPRPEALHSSGGNLKKSRGDPAGPAPLVETPILPGVRMRCRVSG